MELSYDRFRGLSTRGKGETDSQFLARRTELVLRNHKIDVDIHDVQAALEEIASVDPEDAISLVMDLLLGSGLEFEAFDEVRQLSEG